MERSKAKTKKSFDITNENKEYLKEYAIRSNQSPNQAFNDVLYALLSMEAKVKESIAKYCLQQADLIQSRIDSNTERSFHDSLDI